MAFVVDQLELRTRAGQPVVRKGSGPSPDRVSMPAGRGRPVPGPAREYLEGFLGRPMPDARLRTDPPARRAARRIRADAFATTDGEGGGQVVLGDGREPSTPEGLALLGHELTHLAQAERHRRPVGGAGGVGRAMEVEARRTERRILGDLGRGGTSGGSRPVQASPSGGRPAGVGSSPSSGPGPVRIRRLVVTPRGERPVATAGSGRSLPRLPTPPRVPSPGLGTSDLPGGPPVRRAPSDRILARPSAPRSGPTASPGGIGDALERAALETEARLLGGMGRPSGLPSGGTGGVRTASRRRWNRVDRVVFGSVDVETGDPRLAPNTPEGREIRRALREGARRARRTLGSMPGFGSGPAIPRLEVDVDLWVDEPTPARVERVENAIVQAALARSGGEAPPVRTKLWVGNLEIDGYRVTPKGDPVGEEDLPSLHRDVREAIQEIFGVDPRAEGLDDRVRQVLVRWARAATREENLDRPEGERADYTERRTYATLDELARAVWGEVRSEDAVAIEDRLADQVLADRSFEEALDDALRELGRHINEQPNAEEIWEELRTRYSRYKKFFPQEKARQVLEDPSCLDEPDDWKRFRWKFIILDQTYLACFAAEHKPATKKTVRKFGNYRYSGWTVRENNEWVREAREKGMPLWAGPSGTTNQVLYTARQIAGVSDETLEKLAWCAFAFFNRMWTGQSATHRFHEVMDVAMEHGVPYERLTYPDAPPGS